MGHGLSKTPSFMVSASLFTKYSFTIFAPLNPPPPNQQSDGLPLEFLGKGPQTELRTLSPKLRTNPPNIANKQNYKQTGVSDKFRLELQ